MLLGGANSAWAEEVTFTATKDGFTESPSSSGISVVSSVSFDQSNGYNKIEENATITVTPSTGKTITSVVLTQDASKNHYTSWTYSGNSQSAAEIVTFSGLNATSACQFTAGGSARLNSVTVTYTTSGSIPKTVSDLVPIISNFVFDNMVVSSDLAASTLYADGKLLSIGGNSYNSPGFRVKGIGNAMAINVGTAGATLIVYAHHNNGRETRNLYIDTDKTSRTNTISVAPKNNVELRVPNCSSSVYYIYSGDNQDIYIDKIVVTYGTDEYPCDMTSRIPGADFTNLTKKETSSAGTFGEWQFNKFNGGNGPEYPHGTNNSTAFEFYTATASSLKFVLNQTINGLPVGTYKLSAQANNSYNGQEHTNNGGRGYLYAKVGSSEILNSVVVDCNDNDATNYGDYSVIFEVTQENQPVEIGFKTVGTMDGRWFSGDNFKLEYYGTESSKNVTLDATTDATLSDIIPRSGATLSPAFNKDLRIYTVAQSADNNWMDEKNVTPSQPNAKVSRDYRSDTKNITFNVTAPDGTTHGYYQVIYYAPDGWNLTINHTQDGYNLWQHEYIDINGTRYNTIDMDGATLNQRFVVQAGSSWVHNTQHPWLEAYSNNSQKVALLNCLKGQIITIGANSQFIPTGATFVGSEAANPATLYRYFVTQSGNIVFSVPKNGSIKSLTINNGPTISFNTNGGDAIADANIVNLNELPTPVKINHTFVGWYTDEGLTNPVPNPFTPIVNTTLYAKWKKTTIGGPTVGWHKDNSDNIQINNGESYQYTFNNKSEVGYNYQTWCALAFNNSEGTGDAIAGTRPYGCDWITGNSDPTILCNGATATDSEVNAYYALLRAGSPTTVTVSYHDKTIYVSAVNEDGGNTYTLTYSTDLSSKNLDAICVHFTTDKATLTNFQSQQLATRVTGVSLNKTATTLTAGGETETLTVTVAPDGATYKDVVWSTSDAAVATVSSDGVVTPVAGGSANITATTLDGLYAATCAVTVNPLYSYTVNAVDESINMLKEIKAGNVVAGSNVTVHYPKYILKDGAMYEISKNGSHPDFGTTFTPDADNYIKNITYTISALENVVYYTEAEDLSGYTTCDTGNGPAVGSNGKVARGTNNNVTSLATGKYKIWAKGVSNSSRRATFIVGSADVFAFDFNGNDAEQTSDEFTVTELSTLKVVTAGTSSDGLDCFYIIKTGDYTPVLDNKVKITFTTEDRQAVAVVSTPNYGVTASVANGNMTTDGTALKMETATAVTFNIPEGYTATMKFDASNNLGIKVDDVSLAASAVRNLNAGNHTITKGGTMNVSMITIELTPINNDAELTSVTSTAIGAEVTPSGNNVWGVVLPYDYVGETVPVTLNYENANSIVVKDGDATIQPVSSATGSASYNFNIGTQSAPYLYYVQLDSKEYTINVLKLAQEYEKNINVTDFNYYVGTSGISADGNGLDRDLNGVNFTFTGGQGVKVNSESLITVRTRSNTPGTVTIALNGSNTGAHITKVVLGGSGFTAEAANYLTMTGGHISFRNSSELMVVPTTQTNTITFQSNGTDVNITSFTIYTDAALSFTKVTPTATIGGIADKVIVNSTVTPTLTTTPKNFKMAWTYVTNKSNSTIDANTGVIAVGGKTDNGNDKVRAKFAGNDFYNQVTEEKTFEVVKVDAPTIAPTTAFEDGVTTPGTSCTIRITAGDGATIYYTTDGSVPTKSSTQYTATFNITQTTTVKAIAVYTISGVEVISDVTTKSFNYKNPSIYKQQYNSDKSQVAALVVTPNVDTRNTYYNMKDQILKDGETDACVLSWGSYTWCSPNSSNNNKYDGTVRGTYASLNEQPGKTQAIDGYVNTIMTNNNPKSESGTIYNDACAMGNDPLNLPVIGSFARFQPLYNGTVTVWILQNGSSDWHSYDDIDENNDRIPEGSIKGDESYQLDKLRRRPTYVCDEFGTALSNGEDGNEAVVTATLADDAKFDPKTFNAIASAVYGTKTSSQYKSEEADLYDDATNVTTLPTDNSSQAIVDYWQGLIKSRGWTAGGSMNEGHNNTGLVLTPNNGFELMIKQYVKYTFPVIAGKSYYVVGSATNNGLCAAQFTRSNDDVAVDASPIVISETANDFSAITSNVGKQVNVQLNRTFTDGKWYSLVLPFSMNDIQVKQYFGENAAIYWFDSTDSEGNIHWVKHHYQMINAGIPVLIKVTKNFTSGSQIKNVLIQTDKIREYGFGGDYVMTGTWAPTTMPVNCYYISNTASSQDGKEYIASIYRTSKVTNTNGLRAWVRPTSPTASKLYGISFTSILDEETTETPTCISEVLEDTDEIVTPALNNEDLFNIGGQRISAVRFNRLPKGVYIQNGNKFIKK